jgi:hypothetical protein
VARGAPRRPPPLLGPTANPGQRTLQSQVIEIFTTTHCF